VTVKSSELFWSARKGVDRAAIALTLLLLAVDEATEELMGAASATVVLAGDGLAGIAVVDEASEDGRSPPPEVKLRNPSLNAARAAKNGELLTAGALVDAL
jgi:hypothetical protein